MNSVFNERRISRIAKETLNGVDEKFLLFSDGTYALMPEKYVLEGMSVDRDIVIPTLINQPVSMSRTVPILDALYVIRGGRPRPQLPPISAEDLFATPYFDHDGKLRLIVHLTEEKSIFLLCEAFGEHWEVHYENATDMHDKKSTKCVLTCQLPISTERERYVSIVDFDLRGETREQIALSAVCAAAGIYPELYADDILPSDPDVRISALDDGTPECFSSYYVDNFLLDEKSQLFDLVIRNSESNRVVYHKA